MEGFKSNLKMKSKLPSYKEGGYVTKKELVAYEKKEDALEEKQDVAEDKKIVKKAFSMHDKQSHDGEKTDLSKLKKGGRAKKEKGTVKKFKNGGKVAFKYAEGSLVDPRRGRGPQNTEFGPIGQQVFAAQQQAQPPGTPPQAQGQGLPPQAQGQGLPPQAMQRPPMPQQAMQRPPMPQQAALLGGVQQAAGPSAMPTLPQQANPQAGDMTDINRILSLLAQRGIR